MLVDGVGAEINIRRFGKPEPAAVHCFAFPHDFQEGVNDERRTPATKSIA